MKDLIVKDNALINASYNLIWLNSDLFCYQLSKLAKVVKESMQMTFNNSRRKLY